MSFFREAPPPSSAPPLRRPEAIALEELVAAAEEYRGAATRRGGPRLEPQARLTLALNAARNALQMGRVLDGIASDPDIARGHVGSVGMREL